MKKSELDRFSYIEYIVWWEGQINASQLMRYFNLSRDSASSILKKYDQEYPNNLVYDQSARARIITNEFVPSTNVHAFDNYLKLIQASNNEPIIESIEEVQAPFRNISASFVRPILKSIRENLAVDIGYISLSSPNYLDRIIEPHSLIFDGLRWHVRAYCRKNSAFRDFVLSRFNGVAEFEGAAVMNKNNDDLWQNYIDIEIIPDPRLTAKQKSIICTDFQMQGGVKVIKTRIALLNYLLIRLRLDTYKNTPEEQQIVLSNECRKRIVTYLS